MEDTSYMRQMKLEHRQFWTVSLSPKLTAKKWHMGGGWYPDGPHTFPYGGFSKVVLIFNQKHLEGWVVSTTQKAQGNSGFCWAQKPGAWSWQKGRCRRPHSQCRISCGQRGGLLVFPVYTTRTTWIHFGLHRAKVHLLKYRKQFWNPTNEKQVILWVIISN